MAVGGERWMEDRGVRRVTTFGKGNGLIGRTTRG